MNAKKEYTVFLVDDDKLFITTLKSSLKQQFGSLLTISEYTTGEECIKNIDTHPDIVFLDYYLNTNENPDAMDGIKILKEIKAISKNIIVIMLSGQDKLEIAVDAVKCGAYDYIVKSESAFVRIANMITNVTENLNTEKVKKKYWTMNIYLAVIIVSAIIIGAVWYSTTR